MKEYFDVIGYFSSKYISHKRNIISRVHNCLLKALQVEIVLPKLIVMVLDNDIVHNVDEVPRFVCKTEVLGKIMAYLFKELHKVIMTYKEALPNRARRYKYPQIIWIAPPENVNFTRDENRLRSKFTYCLNWLCAMYDEMHTLELKKIWDTEDGNLFVPDAARFTAEGYLRYWSAVDKTVKYFDSTVCRPNNPKQKKEVNNNNNSRDGVPPGAPINNQQRNNAQKRHWNRKWISSKVPCSNRLPDRLSDGRKLPHPPQASNTTDGRDDRRN